MTFSIEPYIATVLPLCLLAIVCAYKWYISQKSALIRKDGPFAPDGPKILPIDSSFDYAKTPARKFRPFKSKYNLTMGISKPDHQDWLLLEHTYLDRINHHKDVFDSEDGPKTCLCSDGEAELAVRELYDYCVSFAVARYPHYFRLLPGQPLVHNTIVNTTLPATSADAVRKGYDGKQLLRILGENFEEDFLLLGFDPNEGEYRLRACTGIASTGFTWQSRMNFKLTDLHGPIPQYKERLQFSMNRYFQKMVVGDLVQRTTYKVQISNPSALFLPEANSAVDPRSNQDLGHTTFMRLERQQLTRLKKTNFILFSIRTYLYPLSDIKAEGLGPDMAQAMRAWPDDFAKYKHRSEWGDAVFAYLEDSS